MGSFFFFLGALQLQGAPTKPSSPSLSPSLRPAPSIPLTPCSWLLGVVNQHPRPAPTPPQPHPSSLNMRALLARCPKLPPVHLMRPELWARPSMNERGRGPCGVQASASRSASGMTQPLSNESRSRAMCQKFTTSQVSVCKKLDGD